jgi:hypothetical protein
MRNKQKTVYAYINGERVWDVLQLALENNVFLDDMKDRIVAEHPDFKVEFKTEPVNEGRHNPHYEPFVCGTVSVKGGFLNVCQIDPVTVIWRFNKENDMSNKPRGWHESNLWRDNCGRRYFGEINFGNIYLDEVERGETEDLDMG